MRMKKLLVIIILLGLVVPSVKATGQSGDIIRLEGEEWVLIMRLNEKCVEYEKLVYLFRSDDGNMRTGMQSHGIKKAGYADWTCRCTMPEL